MKTTVAWPGEASEGKASASMALASRESLSSGRKAVWSEVPPPQAGSEEETGRGRKEPSHQEEEPEADDDAA